MRKALVWVALVVCCLTRVPASAAEPACSDACRQRLLLSKPGPTSSQACGADAVSACMVALAEDLVAVELRLDAEAETGHARSKRDDTLIDLARKLNAAAAAAGGPDVEQVKELAGRVLKALEPLPGMACSDPLTSRRAIGSAIQVLGGVEGRLSSSAADGIGEAKRVVGALKKELEQAAACGTEWKLLLPGARSQNTAAGPAEVLINDYLLDAKRGYRRLVEHARKLAPRSTGGPATRFDLESCLDASGLSESAGFGKAALAEAPSSEKALRPLSRSLAQERALASRKDATPEERYLALAEVACNIDVSLDGLLTRQGLRPVLIGTLKPAVGFTQVGDDANGSSETETKPAVLVTFASRHLSFPRRLLWGIGGMKVAAVGDIGYAPVLEPSSPEPKDDELASERAAVLETTAKLRTAFLWDLGPKLGRTFSDRVELAIAGRFGQTQVGTPASVEGGTKGQPATLGISSNTGWQWFKELGFRGALLGNGSGHVAEAYELGTLRPLLAVEYGFRWDDRLRTPDYSGVDPGDEIAAAREAELSAAFESKFGSHSERRQFLRVSLRGLPVVGADKPFKLNFALEHEWHGWGVPGLPASTKVYLAGEIDLIKALTGK